MEFGPQQIGKWIIVMGITIALVGVLVMILGRAGLFKLPGRFGVRRQKLANLFSDSELCSNIDCADSYFMAY